MSKAKNPELFLKEPQKHDYPAAQDYLELLFDEDRARMFAERLQEGSMKIKKSKDIFRASELPLLPRENPYVAENLKKIKNKVKLSPILLVRGKNRLIIADGYHRMCAA